MVNDEREISLGAAVPYLEQRGNCAIVALYTLV